ncbi:hypothetical protein D3C72_1375060 [compost metagenome]
MKCTRLSSAPGTVAASSALAAFARPSAMRSALELLRQWRSRKSLRSLTRRRCSGAVAVTGWPLRSRMATMANCGKAYMPCVFN